MPQRVTRRALLATGVLAGAGAAWTSLSSSWSARFLRARFAELGQQVPPAPHKPAPATWNDNAVTMAWLGPCIGPQAFEQDMAWLAGIVFHELVHSPQYAYYAERGVPQVNPKRSETERLMIALDEYEAYWWSLKRSVELALSSAQQNEIRRRAQYAFIDLDDSTIGSLAQKQQFDAARDELIRRYNAKAGSQVATCRRNLSVCCA